jgi:hypothetical protein
MHAFTIDPDNNITVYATRKAAKATGACVFDTAENFAELIGPDSKRLVDIWNGLTGVTPVRKFTSRAIAAKRIFAEVGKLAAPANETPAESGGGAAKTKRVPARPGAAKQVVRKTKAGPKPGGKKEILVRLISRKNGASLEELTVALDWQKHSVRGLIATLGKAVKIESFKTEQGVRTYRTSQRTQK